MIPSLKVGIGEEGFTLRGEGYYALIDAVEAVARSALSGGGLSRREAENYLLSGCREFLEHGADSAVKRLTEKLMMPVRTWRVIKPGRMFFQAPRITIGACELQRGLPDAPAGNPWTDFIQKDFPAFSISTSVEAHDVDAAIRLADQRFSEALAVMQLSDPRGEAVLGAPVLVVADDGGYSYNHLPQHDLDLEQIADRSGNLWPHARALSAAAAKPEDDRSDWERRALAAARWLSKAIVSRWPSDSLVSLMVALESLFVESRTVGEKGRTIAQEVSRRWVLRSMTQDAERAWLEELYRRRNDAVHEGRNFLSDLDVDRLKNLVWLAVGWAAHHLDPHHRRDQVPCSTFQEALADHPE
jgi:hypothetical protein